MLLPNKTLLITASVMVLTCLIYMSCKQQDPTTDQYTSEVPKIEFTSIKKFRLKADPNRVGYAERDSVVITIRYFDADNDLGEDPLDSARIRKVLSPSGWGNYDIKTFVSTTGQSTTLITPVTNWLFFSQNSLSNTDKFTNSPFSGELDKKTLSFSQRFSIPRVRPVFYKPTKFQVKIRDRQLNESNMIETDTLHLPWPD
jgi:hypothetical protein